MIRWLLVRLPAAVAYIGWMIVFFSISPSRPGQLSLLLSAGREMSTGRSAVMLRGWEVKEGMVHSTCGWQVKLCDPTLTRANLSALKMSITRTMKHYTNVLFTAYLNRAGIWPII